MGQGDQLSKFVRDWGVSWDTGLFNAKTGEVGKSGRAGHSNTSAPLKLFTVGRAEVEEKLEVTGNGAQLRAA